MATENAKRMDILSEDPLNIQLIQELRQQRLGVQEGAQIPPVSIDQEAIVQGPAQGYSSVPGYEDWQNSTRPRQDSQYPQDFTAFGRPQRDAWGQQGTRRQGQRTCFGCGGSHRFTEYECQGLKDLIQQGFVHLSDRRRLVAGTHERPGPELPWLSNKGRLKGIKNWLRTY